MINLRFHIVSITAVFLALAIGIFMGSTLLDRSTVELLESRQKSLDRKIADRVVQSNAFRAALDAHDRADTAFGTQLIRPLTKGLVSAPVLFLAARGIDEDSLQRTKDDVTAAGGSVGGTLWFDDQSLLSDGGIRSAVVAAAAGGSGPSSPGSSGGSADEAVSKANAALAADLAAKSDSTEAPVSLAALQSAGFFEWDLPAGATGVTFGATAYRLVVVSGEGSSTKVDAMLVKLIGVLADATPGQVTVAELLVDRSTTGLIERNLDRQPPVRGSFVDRLRNMDEPPPVPTIDDLDRTQGRLSLLLILANLAGAVPGSFGETPTANAPFPPVPPTQ